MNTLKIHPYLPRAGRLQTAGNHRGVHWDSVNEALIRLWKITLICCDSMIVIYMVYIKTHVFSLILYYNCKYFNPKWVFHYVIIQIILFGVKLFRSLVLNKKLQLKQILLVLNCCFCSCC